jgi:hypothetical protein
VARHRRRKLRKASSGGAYARQADAVVTSITSQANLRRESPPSVTANAIGRAVAAQHPRTRYALGYGARPTIFMHDILRDRWYDAIIAGPPAYRPDHRARQSPH